MDTPLTRPLKISGSSADPSPQVPELLTTTSNVVVADEQHLDGSGSLTGKTTAQMGLYTHTCVRMPGPLVIDPGA